MDLLSIEWIELIAGMAALVWASFKASDRARWLRAEQNAKGVQAIEGAVEHVYQNFVREWKKEAGENGAKLTNDQRDKALRIAREIAEEEARRVGVELGRLYGPRILDGLINLTVSRQKRGVVG